VCSGIDLVVLGWLVLSLGGSAAGLALMAALNAGASVPAVFFTGPLIDRFSRRAVTLGTEVTRITLVAAVPVLGATGHLALWHVLAAGAGANAAHSVSSASYSALLADLFDRGKLLRANGVWQVTTQLGLAAGAAAGGWCIPLLGETGALLPEVGGRVLSCALLLVTAIVPPARHPAGLRRHLLLHDMVQAWRLLLATPPLLWTTLFVGVPGSLITGIDAVLPAFVRQDNGMGAHEYGLIGAGWGAGGFVAGLLCVTLPQAHGEHRVRTGSLLGTGLALTLFGLAANLPLLVVTAALAGAASLGALLVFRTYVQVEAQPGYAGRIMSVSQLVLSVLWLGVALGMATVTLLVPVRVFVLLWGLGIAVAGVVLHVLLYSGRAPSAVRERRGM
jgi:MFS family permease